MIYLDLTLNSGHYLYCFPVWRYIPAKIQTLVCNIVALDYCSFSHSNIQLLQFNIAHSQFNVHISNTTWLEHATLLFYVQCIYTV